MASKKSKSRKKTAVASSRKGANFSLDRWMSQTSREEELRRCVVSKNPEWVQVIRTVLQKVAKGQYQITIKALHRMLQEEYGFPYTYRTLLRYVREREPKLWNATYGSST